MRWLVLLLALPLVPPAARAEETAARIDVLILRQSSEHAFRVDEALAKRLAADGIDIVTRDLADPISAEALRLFDVVALPDFSGLLPPSFGLQGNVVRHLGMKNNIARIHDYVRAGGALFYSPLVTTAGLPRTVAASVAAQRCRLTRPCGGGIEQHSFEPLEASERLLHRDRGR